jgi:hypothetical protein
MQLVHLLVADALWIACVLLAARVLGTDRVVSAAAAALTTTSEMNAR